MFLRSLADSAFGTLDRKDPHVLKSFDLRTSRKLVSTLVKYLEEDFKAHSDGGASVLPTKEHIKWTMQVVGHAFSLPIEDCLVMVSALSLYKKWLFDNNRPQAIVENEQEFFQDIFLHISMLFKVRRSTAGSLLDRHALLCKKALNIFCLISSAKYHKRMTPACWEMLLRVLVGVADELLNGPVVGPTLGNCLEKPLLRALFDVWLRSGTSNPTLWHLLAKCSRMWLHRKNFLVSWKAVCVSLAARVFRIFYRDGSLESGHDAVSVTWPDGYVTSVYMSDKKAIYFWHQILHLIGNPERMNDPETFMIAVEVLSDLADEFMSRNLTTLPNGNFILEAFGPKLFDVALKDTRGFEQGRANAFGALCRIFCQHTGHAFSSDNLKLFYRALIRMLSSQTTDSIVVEAVFSNCSSLFALRPEGCWSLIPYFVPHLREILSNQDYHRTLRRSAILLVGSLLCLNTHFFVHDLWVQHRIQLQSESDTLRIEDERPSRKESRQEMGRHLGSLSGVLVNALLTEKDEMNLDMILWLVTARMHEECLVPSRDAIADTFPQVVFSNVWKLLTTNVWSYRVKLSAYEMLANLSSLQSMIHRLQPSAIPELLTNLAAHIELTLLQPPEPRGEPRPDRDNKRIWAHHAIVAAIWCLYQWLTSAPWVMRSPTLTNVVMAALLLGERSKLSDIRNLCSIALRYLLNEAGLHPASSAPVLFPEHATLCFKPGTVPKLSPVSSLLDVRPDDTLNSSGIMQTETQKFSANFSVQPSLGSTPSHQVLLAPGGFCAGSPDFQSDLIGPPTSSTCVSSDEAIVRYLQDRGELATEEGEHPIHHFLVDRRVIVSLIETLDPSNPSDCPNLVVIMRDLMGKRVWRVSNVTKGNKPPTPAPIARGGASRHAVDYDSEADYPLDAFAKALRTIPKTTSEVKKPEPEPPPHLASSPSRRFADVGSLFPDIPSLVTVDLTEKQPGVSTSSLVNKSRAQALFDEEATSLLEAMEAQEKNEALYWPQIAEHAAPCTRPTREPKLKDEELSMHTVRLHLANLGLLTGLVSPATMGIGDTMDIPAEASEGTITKDNLLFQDPLSMLGGAPRSRVGSAVVPAARRVQTPRGSISVSGEGGRSASAALLNGAPSSNTQAPPAPTMVKDEHPIPIPVVLQALGQYATPQTGLDFEVLSGGTFLSQSLAALDEISVTQSFTIAVLFRKEGQVLLSEMCANMPETETPLTRPRSGPALEEVLPPVKLPTPVVLLAPVPEEVVVQGEPPPEEVLVTQLEQGYGSSGTDTEIDDDVEHEGPVEDGDMELEEADPDGSLKKPRLRARQSSSSGSVQDELVGPLPLLIDETASSKRDLSMNLSVSVATTSMHTISDHSSTISSSRLSVTATTSMSSPNSSSSPVSFNLKLFSDAMSSELTRVSPQSSSANSLEPNNNRYSPPSSGRNSPTPTGNSPSHSISKGENIFYTTTISSFSSSSSSSIYITSTASSSIVSTTLTPNAKTTTAGILTLSRNPSTPTRRTRSTSTPGPTPIVKPRSSKTPTNSSTLTSPFDMSRDTSDSPLSPLTGSGSSNNLCNSSQSSSSGGSTSSSAGSSGSSGSSTVESCTTSSGGSDGPDGHDRAKREARSRSSHLRKTPVKHGQKFEAFLRDLTRQNPSKGQPAFFFHVPTLMTTTNRQRHSLVLNDGIRIIWSQDKSDWEPLAEEDQKDTANEEVLYIVIWPYPGGLFRVKLWSRALQGLKASKPKEEAKAKTAAAAGFSWKAALQPKDHARSVVEDEEEHLPVGLGPLMPDVLIGEPSLVAMIRQAITNVTRRRQHMKGVLNPFLVRQKMIEEISKEQVVRASSDQILHHHLFGPV